MDDVGSAGTRRRSFAGCADEVQRTLVTPIGISILIAMLYVSPAMGWFERGRAKLLLDLDVPSPYRDNPPRDRWWRPFVSRVTDPATWMHAVTIGAVRRVHPRRSHCAAPRQDRSAAAL